MLTRREFAGLLPISLAFPAQGKRLSGQAVAPLIPAGEARAIEARTVEARTIEARTIKARTINARTSVMMWTLSKSGSFEQNLDRVAQAGYNQVELVSEFKSWTPSDMVRILARMRSLGITVDAMAGMTLGFANPTGGDAFLAELKSLIPVAHQLGCPQIILLSGDLSGNRSISQALDTGSSQDNSLQHSASIQTLKRAAKMLGDANLVGVIEPIDRIENPSIYLDGVTEAFAIVRAIDSPHLRVLYDLYHEQRTHGNLIEKLQRNIDLVGLIHVADVPGRHQPGTGEVDYDQIYSALAQLSYTGTIAMEFYPAGDVVATLRGAREQVLRSYDSIRPVQ